MHTLLKRFFFVIEETGEPAKNKFIVEFRAENLELAKQEYAEVLGWCGGYNVIKIVERNADEPANDDFLTSLTVPSGNS